MKKALTIGIDSYPTNPLSGCVNDATSMSAVLSTSVCGFLTRTLLDANATRARIKQEIQWVLADSDFSIIYFAGHGEKTDVTTYLTTIDSVDGDEGVDVNWIQQAMTRLAREDQTVVLLLDCCHSGSAPVEAGTSVRSLAPNDLPSLRGRGRILIAACKGDQLAGESNFEGEQHGEFTRHLLNALKGYASNEKGVVTVSAAYDYVAWQFDGNHDQIPTFRGDHEGVVVLAMNVPRVGTWTPASPDQLLSREKALALGNEYLSRVLQSLSTPSHQQWQMQGYRAAIQVFEPIAKWFRRTIENQPALLSDPDFIRLNQTCQQYAKQLGGLTTGTEMPQGKAEESLGSGTFGTVFRVVDRNGGSDKCFKLYHAQDLHEQAKVGRFRRGYQAMKQMDHPAIVKVREFSDVPLGFFMDFVDGPNARSYLPGITDDPTQVIKLLLQVAETLQHAHGRNVIHRDVKPENILIRIDQEGQANAFLTDFDLAWFSSATKMTKLAEGFGSHFYAAPEQMAKPNSPAARSEKVDVYSFGQLCFFFITGRDPMPLDVHNNVKVLTDTLGQRWTDPHEAKKLVDFYRAATQHEPGKRPGDFRGICQLLAGLELALRSPAENYDLAYFLSCVRFTIAGDFLEKPSPVSVTMRSRSGMTELTLMIVTENEKRVAIDAAFRPDNIFVDGMKSHDARTIINQRVDAALHPYQTTYGVRRTGAKSGAFEFAVRIENLTKAREGVLTAREIISKVLDIVEHT